MKLNLVSSKSDRNYVMTKESEGAINLVKLLKKYGEVVDYMTEPMVANFYGVGNNAIKTIGTDNAGELSKYGYRVYKRGELLKLEPTTLEKLGNIPNRGLRLYPIKAVILIGMMLTESKVAEKLRQDIIDIIFENKVTIPTDNSIRNIVHDEVTTEFDKRCPQLIGSKDLQVKAIVKTVKRVMNKKLADTEYYIIIDQLKLNYGVTKLEDIPSKPDILFEVTDLAYKYMRKVNKQKFLPGFERDN